jgi:hypothetical protein
LMADGRLRALRTMVVAQATLFGSSATADQVADFVDTGWLGCTADGAEPRPMPYDQAALKTLVESGRMG